MSPAKQRLPYVYDEEALRVSMQVERERPKVIILSGLEDITMAQQSVTLGANDYIAKPYRGEALLKYVECVLGS